MGISRTYRASWRSTSPLRTVLAMLWPAAMCSVAAPCLMGVVAASLLLISCGCNAIPDVRTKTSFHNPFPQLSRVAVLPFRNQSEEPTLSGIRVSMAYYNELQSVPGFEVLPIGVVETQLQEFERVILRRPIATSEDFQRFAKFLGVDAVLQGAITDYSAYYPPRMTLKVNWYAANQGLHPIPVGYGLPWGTKDEKKIPSWVRLEAERELARKQMQTQTPVNYDEDYAQSLSSTQHTPGFDVSHDSRDRAGTQGSVVQLASAIEPVERPAGESVEPERIPAKLSADRFADQQYGESMEVFEQTSAPRSARDMAVSGAAEMSGIPSDWPDPRGFIPPRPREFAPEMMPQYEPVISHMKAYNGNDEDFTQSLQEYFYFRDDARFGGWQSYLQRSEDFIRFCCHLHISETLSSRGGQIESRLNLRWPVYRYER